MTTSAREAQRRATKCRYADKYKATRAPTCGCKVCLSKWAAKQLETKR